MQFVAFRVYTDSTDTMPLARRAALVAELARPFLNSDNPDVVYDPDAAIWLTFPCGALMFPLASAMPIVDTRCNCGAHWVVRYERAEINKNPALVGAG
jgi:hypothetical protein